MIEKLLKFSINNRFFILMLTAIIVGIGGYSLTQMSIDAVPDITNVQIQINTSYPALTPVEFEKQITFPVETAMAGIPGLDYTRSFSRNGFSQVTVVFKDNMDIYFARQQVAERLLDVRDSLPAGAEPKMGPITTGLGEIYMWTVDFDHQVGKDAVVKEGEPGWQKDGTYLTPEGEHLSNEVQRLAYLRTIQDWVIRPQLRNVQGLAGVDSLGGYKKQYHVQADPDKMVLKGVTFQQLTSALERNNVSIGAGSIERNGEGYLVRAAGRIEHPDQIANIVVAVQNGHPVYVRDIAVVEIGKELRYGTGSTRGHECVVGTALMLAGANSRIVAVAVDEKLTQINKTLPPDIQARTTINRSKLVNATIHTVGKNLIEGAILVIVVLFVLLGNFRAAIIAAMAIPLSMLLTATGMVQVKISGNLMSLGAVDFGLIVDGAVIIVENCLRRLAEKQHAQGRILTLPERLHEVMEASKEMIRPSLYGQGIIIIVYLPILSLTGIEGKMFHPMATTVIFALIAAFVLSLTFVPAMVALLVSGRVSEKDNFLIRFAKRIYTPIVAWALKLRWVVAGTAVAMFALSLLLFASLGQEFVPQLDELDLDSEEGRITSASIDASTKIQLEVEKVIATFPEVRVVFSKTGTAELGADPMPVNKADCYIVMKPREEWPNPNEPKIDLIRRFEAALANVPGTFHSFSQPIQMRFNELIAGVKTDIGIKVFGDDFEQMKPIADKVAAMLKSINGAADVKVQQIEGLPVMNIDIDRDLVARYGLNVADVQDVIQTAIGGKEAGQIFEGDRRFELIVKLPDRLRTSQKALEQLPIPLPLGDSDKVAALQPGFTRHQPFIPLSAVAKITVSEGPNEISRENGKRLIIVEANVRARDIGSFVEEAKKKIDAEVKIPSGNWIEWGGQFENLINARERLMIVVPICFFLIFLLLYSNFKSFKQALVVFTGVPLALTGGIVSLWLRGIPFSISAGVGFIALSGVAVLNGLVMVSFINQLRIGGMARDEAVKQGSLTRLRPVLMTALVASLGFVPMAFATGTGAEVQRPLATVVIGGLISSTLLTLIVLPALYRIFERDEALQIEADAL